MMHGHYNERMNCSGSGRAAETRRAHPAPSRAPRSALLTVHLNSGSRARKTLEQRLGSSRRTSDAASAPAVVAETVTSDNGSGEARSRAVPIPPDPGLTAEADPAASTDDLDEQLASRRMSNFTASTSSASLPSFDDDTFARFRAPQPPASPLSLLWPSSSASPSASSRNQPTSPSGFPAFPRPPEGPGSLAAQPPAPPQVPPEAAQLYAGSSIANNLSATTSSSDVLASAFDVLQLEPPAPSGPSGSPASNAQRVYKATTTAATSGEAGSGGAGSATAASSAVRRKRAQVRVIDASELLLARDEAVKTELLGRTWNDLLQFEERLGTGDAGAGAPGVAGVVSEPAQQEGVGQQPPSQQQQQLAAGGQAGASLEEVIEYIQQQVSARREEVVAGQRQGQWDGIQRERGAVGAEEQRRDQHQGAEGQQQRRLSSADIAGRDTELLMRSITEAGDWECLQRIFGEHRAALSLEHLATMLLRLATVFNRKGGVARGKRAAFFVLFDAVVEQVVFTAPDLRGPQAVAVIRALACMPMTFSPRVRSTLEATKRVLVNSQPSVLPVAYAGAGSGELGGGQGGVILNASQVAAIRRGAPAGRPAGGGLAGAAGAGGGGGGGAPGQQAVPGATQLPGLAPAAPPGATPTAAAAAAAATAAGAAGGMDGWQGDMRGGDYAALAYYLGRMNARARPLRMSLRLPPSFGRAFLRCSYATFGSCRPHHFGQMLYGLANLRLAPPPHWLYAFYLSSARSLPAMNVLELTMLMYGACRLPVKPPAPWIEAYLECVARRLPEMDGGGLALVLHSLGRLKYRPQRGFLDRYMQTVYEALAAGRLQPVELSHLLRGLTFLGVVPEEGQLAPLWETSGAAMERGEVSAPQLANLAWALGLLKVRIPHRWYGLLLVNMRAQHQQLRPYHRRRLLAALHAFGSRDLQSWYELLRIPLEEMPGYKELKAQLAMRRVQRAKALLMAEKKREQMLREQAEKKQQGLQQGQGQQQRPKQERQKQQATKQKRKVKVLQLKKQKHQAAQQQHTTTGKTEARTVKPKPTKEAPVAGQQRPGQKEAASQPRLEKKRGLAGAAESAGSSETTA